MCVPLPAAEGPWGRLERWRAWCGWGSADAVAATPASHTGAWPRPHRFGFQSPAGKRQTSQVSWARRKAPLRDRPHLGLRAVTLDSDAELNHIRKSGLCWPAVQNRHQFRPEQIQLSGQRRLRFWEMPRKRWRNDHDIRSQASGGGVHLSSGCARRPGDVLPALDPRNTSGWRWRRERPEHPVLRWGGAGRTQRAGCRAEDCPRVDLVDRVQDSTPAPACPQPTGPLWGERQEHYPRWPVSPLRPGASAWSSSQSSPGPHRPPQLYSVDTHTHTNTRAHAYVDQHEPPIPLRVGSDGHLLVLPVLLILAFDLEQQTLHHFGQQVTGNLLTCLQQSFGWFCHRGVLTTDGLLDKRMFLLQLMSETFRICLPRRTAEENPLFWLWFSRPHTAAKGIKRTLEVEGPRGSKRFSGTDQRKTNHLIQHSVPGQQGEVASDRLLHGWNQRVGQVFLIWTSADDHGHAGSPRVLNTASQQSRHLDANLDSSNIKSGQTSSNGALASPESVFLLLPVASEALAFLAEAFFCFGGISWKNPTNKRRVGNVNVKEKVWTSAEVWRGYFTLTH